MLVTDLSDWNDHINWSHLIAAGVSGAIVKISEGRSLTQLHGKHIAGAEARDCRGALIATRTHKLPSEQEKKQIE